MKKTGLLLLLNFIVLYAGAQGMAVTNAILLHKEGILDKAKDNIDKASLHEKTSNQAKTWYYKGLIYLDLYKSEKPEYKSLVSGLEDSYESFQKAQELDKAGGEYNKLSADKLNELWAQAINDGIKLGNESKHQEAISSYEIAQKIKPADTTAYLYAAYSAEELKDNKLIKGYYNKLIEMNYKNPGIYSNLSYIYQNEDKDIAKALEIIQKGRKEFPNSKKLIENEINIYLSTNRLSEAKSKMEQAILVDDKNATLYYNLGTIYEKSGEPAKALESYKKALAIEPNNFDANFNMGAFYYNQAAEIIKKVNAMNLSTYQKEGKAKEDEAVVYMKQGLPFFEKAYQKDATDANVKKILKDIYTRCKMETKASALK